MSRLLEQFNKEIHSQLGQELGIKNPMQIPRLKKVVISMGTGTPTIDRNRGGEAAADLAKITGQRPDMRRARKSVSNFKIRDGYEVGCRVTLRGKRMYEFVDRLIMFLGTALYAVVAVYVTDALRPARRRERTA